MPSTFASPCPFSRGDHDVCWSGDTDYRIATRSAPFGSIDEVFVVLAVEIRPGEARGPFQDFIRATEFTNRFLQPGDPFPSTDVNPRAICWSMSACAGQDRTDSTPQQSCLAIQFTRPS